MSYYCENPECPDPYLGFDRRRFKCARCTVLYYCSPECQKVHWKKHKEQCFDHRTQSVVQARLFTQLCPLTSKIGPHCHAPVKLTKEQLAQTKVITDFIRKLPGQNKLRLSCGCQKRLYGKFMIQFALGPDMNLARIYVFATCFDEKCYSLSKGHYPLVILQKPQNLLNFEVYAVLPYTKMKNPPIELLNCNCDGLTEMQKTNHLAWMHHETDYYVGTMSGTTFRMMPPSGIWA